MPLIPPKLPNLYVLATLLAIVTNLSFYRELFKGGLSATMARIRKASGLLVNPRRHLLLHQTLSQPEIRPVSEAAPGLAFKYLGDYLGISFTRRDRASILSRHYELLTDRVRPGFFHDIVEGRILLWEHCPRESVYRIWLTFPQSTHCEGDLSLILQADAVDIYTLSFSIGPGPVAGLAKGDAVFVARIQGKGGGFTRIQRATKEMLEVSPAALLLAAAEGVSMALGIDNLIGISGSDQISAVGETRRSAMLSTYDEFWVSMGGVSLNRALYRLAVPLPEKPLQSTQRRHRSRVMSKRQFKLEVKTAVRAKFASNALRTDHE